MIPVLYRCLLRLHPSEFRLRFQDEMLCIFDEAAPVWGTPSLLRDAITSLFRQWLMRSGLWKWVVATVAAFIPLLLAFGSFFLGTGLCILKRSRHIGPRFRGKEVFP